LKRISISKPEYSIEGGWHVASAFISVNDKTHRLEYKASEGPITKGSEPFVAAALFLSMKIGQPLEISGTVSPKLLTATYTIQDIFHRWFPEFRKIPVHAEPGSSDEVSRTAEVGAFFSGGVDSFYTFLKHKDEITKIIFVHGLDIKLEKTALRSKVSKEIRRVAQELGKPLLEVETNVHEFADKYQYNGSLLPSIGLILSAQFKKIYIPSNLSYDHAFPDSSHPLLDPLWSTEALTFGHDGCEVNRVEKIARISQSDVAMRSLRVCLQNREDSLNCGQCEKCLRTMTSLQAVGALECCTAFNKKLDIEAVSRMKLRDQLLPYAEGNLLALENNGNNPELVEALRFCIKSFKYRKMENLLHKNFKEFLDSDLGAKFVSGKKNTIFRCMWQSEREWLLREALKEIIKKLDQRFLFGMIRRRYDAV
jgi:hypothetical protein